MADDELRRDVPTPELDDSSWASVAVPGHWRLAPEFADADGPLFYRRRFEAPAPETDRRSWLVLHGVFAQSDIWLDGVYLGDTEGYFAPHDFEVSDALRDRSEHLLVVEVACQSLTDPGSKRSLTGAFQQADQWLPPTNPGGIWRPVEIVETGPVRIKRCRALCSEASAERAVLSLRLMLDSAGARAVTIRTTVHDAREGRTAADRQDPHVERVEHVEHVERHPLAAGSNRVEWKVRVDDPKLWWPRRLGKPDSVEVAVEVVDDETDTVSDRRVIRMGLRQVRARNWVFEINGERLFLKGVNLDPTRMLPASASADEIQRDIEVATDLGLDFVRVAAHIARPELYTAADEAGMLVWQDLPIRGIYSRTVRRQAVRAAQEAVDLLGHHPSVMLWCGHDEPAPGLDGSGAEGPSVMLRRVARRHLPTWSKSVLDLSVNRALERADPTRPVNAHSGVALGATNPGGDTHLWYGWRNGALRDLPTAIGRLPRLARFVSAFGAGSVPPTDRFADTSRWPELNWDVLEAEFGLEKAALLSRVPPAAHGRYDEWKAATQQHQADVIRHTVEHLRRLSYRPTGGFSVSTLADPRDLPQISMSLIDHRGQAKPALDALREACRPVIVTADLLPDVVTPGEPLAVDVHVVSELREALERATVEAETTWPGGGHRWRWEGDVDPDGCTRIGIVQMIVGAPTEPGTLSLSVRLEHRGVTVATHRQVSRLVLA